MSTEYMVLSPHEQRIKAEQQGVKDVRGRERVYKILNSYQATCPTIDIERAKYFTESFN